MGSHDCRVSASINLKPEVTEDDVKRVLKDYLKAQSFTYDRLHEDGSIEFEAGSLHLSIDVFGYGGYQDDALDGLVEGLCTIVEGRDYIEFLDFDTGDSEAQCTPHFIGATAEDRELAKVDYGLMLMEPFVASVVGKEAFQSITDNVLSAANTALGSCSTVQRYRCLIPRTIRSAFRRVPNKSQDLVFRLPVSARSSAYPVAQS